MTAVLDANAGIDVAASIVEKATGAGADEAKAQHVYSETFEVTYDNEEVGLIRTTVNDTVSLTTYVGTAKGQSTLTGRSPDLLDKAVREAVAASRSGVADEANVLAPGTSTGLTEMGHDGPDRDEMVDAAMRHIRFMAEHYPLINMRDSTYQFTTSWRSFANSNGLTRQERRAGYVATSIFSARDGQKATSFNYTSASSVDPFGELIEVGTLRSLLDATMSSFDPKPVPSTFTGDIIFTPDSLSTILGPVLNALDGYMLMRGTSPYQDAEGEVIASPALTVRNRPLSPEFPLAAGFDGDGVAATDLDVIVDGVLRSHLIGWYPSRKLGREMTAGVTHVEVAPGDTSFEEMVASTERGIVLGRFSGGAPNQKLDFSGVAKNSFYVEDGKIQHPIAETMVAGNFADLLRNIRAMGDTAVNYGGHSFPAMATSGATISTK